MDAITIPGTSTGPIEEAAAILRQRCEAIQVTNDEEHRAAAELELDLARMEKAVYDLFRDAKRAADQAHKAICEAERKLREPLVTAKRIVSQKSMAWERVEREKAAERARIETDRQHQERVAAELERANRLHEQGAPKSAELVVAKAVEMPVIPVRPEEPQKIAGLGSREMWTAKVEDIGALVQYVALMGRQDKDWYELLEPNVRLLNMLAKDNKEKLAIPGVSAVKELIRTRRV